MDSWSMRVILLVLSKSKEKKIRGVSRLKLCSEILSLLSKGTKDKFVNTKLTIKIEVKGQN